MYSTDREIVSFRSVHIWMSVDLLPWFLLSLKKKQLSRLHKLLLSSPPPLSPNSWCIRWNPLSRVFLSNKREELLNFQRAAKTLCSFLLMLCTNEKKKKNKKTSSSSMKWHRDMPCCYIHYSKTANQQEVNNNQPLLRNKLMSIMWWHTWNFLHPREETQRWSCHG